jgi:hypothetical protein
VIEFGETKPEGALHVAEGTAFEVRAAIHGTATLAQDGKTWLAPGVFEAGDDKARLQALMNYRQWLIDRASVNGAA